jgi:hypothetical protein
MSNGFLDFSFGNDDNVGKKTSRFKAEGGRTYRVSLVGFRSFNPDGTPDVSDAQNAIRFAGCERIYKPGVGYILYKSPAYAEFGTPKQAIATVICVWPTNKDGELDEASTLSVQKGVGWQVMPWVFSADKYTEIKRKHKRFPLTEHDLSLSCTDTQYQKITFSSERTCLLARYLASENEAHRAVGMKIVREAQAVMNNIHRDLARDLSLDEIREKLGEGAVTPTGTSGGHTDESSDDILDSVL